MFFKNILKKSKNEKLTVNVPKTNYEEYRNKSHKNILFTNKIMISSLETDIVLPQGFVVGKIKHIREQYSVEKVIHDSPNWRPFVERLLRQPTQTPNTTLGPSRYTVLHAGRQLVRHQSAAELRISLLGMQHVLIDRHRVDLR